MQRNCYNFIFLVTFIVFNYASGGLGQGGTEFCVANMNKKDLDKLLAGLNWACGHGGANCSSIQQGQPCYDSNNLAALASFAFDDYYQKSKATGDTRDFNGTAMLTSTDPKVRDFWRPDLRPSTLIHDMRKKYLVYATHVKLRYPNLGATPPALCANEQCVWKAQTISAQNAK